LCPTDDFFKSKVLLHRATLFDKEGKSKEAVTDFHKSVVYNPSLVESFENLATKSTMSDAQTKIFKYWKEVKKSDLGFLTKVNCCWMKLQRENLQCCIFQHEPLTPVKTPCGHIFDLEFINIGFSEYPSCPLCQKPFDKEYQLIPCNICLETWDLKMSHVQPLARKALRERVSLIVSQLKKSSNEKRPREESSDENLCSPDSKRRCI
jgi:hypothetical protein